MSHHGYPLHAPIAATRDEREAALVEGDRLQVAGDPRGELIVAQIRGHERLVRSLLERHAETWLAGLSNHPVFSIDWRLGAVDTITIHHDAADDDFPVLLARLLAAPAIEAAGVRAIHATASPDQTFDPDPGLADFAGMIDALAEASSQVRASIRELACDYLWPHAVDLGAVGVDLGSLDAVWAALPALEHAAFRAHELELGTPPADRLRFLGLFTPYGLSASDYAAVAGTHWSVLETLAVGRYAAPLAVLQPLLDARGVPALRNLALFDVHNDVLDRMAGSAVVEQLETLELSWIRLHREPEPRLDRRDRAFAHLRRFHYSD